MSGKFRVVRAEMVAEGCPLDHYFTRHPRELSDGDIRALVAHLRRERAANPRRVNSEEDQT